MFDARESTSINNNLLSFGKKWIDFVFLHEWSHIVLGHLDYCEMNNQPFYELNIKERKKKFNNVYLEINADDFATKVFSIRFAFGITTIAKATNINESKLLEEMIMAMIYLFDLFFQLSGENKRGTHPSPHERMTIFVVSLAESLKRKNDIFPIQLTDFINLIQKCMIRFSVKNFEKYKLDKTRMIQDIQELIKNYMIFLKDESVYHHKILKDAKV